jgi:hypothetical protein
MKSHTTGRGAAATSKAALALDPRAVARAPGGHMVSRHSNSLHDAIVLADALPTTAQPAGTA